MSAIPTVALTSIVMRSPEQVSGDIDAQAVLLSIENGKYYKMSPMGTYVWSHLEAPTRVGELIEQLMGEFDVERSVCEAEVLAFLSHLQTERLLTVKS